jgi:hypothetical protein
MANVIFKKLPNFQYTPPRKRSEIVNVGRQEYNELWKILRRFPEKFQDKEMLLHLLGNPNITMKFIENNNFLSELQDKEKVLKFLLKNPNITLEFLKEHNIELKWENNTAHITNFDYEDCKTILKNVKGNNSSYRYEINNNFNLTPEQKNKLLDTIPSPSKNFEDSDWEDSDFEDSDDESNVNGYDPRIKPIYSFESDSKRIVYEGKHVPTRTFYNFQEAKSKGDIACKNGKCESKDADDILSSPFIMFDDIKDKFPKKYLTYFSSNPNLTVKILEQNPDIPWDWEKIAKNPFNCDPIVFYTKFVKISTNKGIETETSKQFNKYTNTKTGVTDIISDYAKFGIRRKTKRGKKGKKKTK